MDDTYLPEILNIGLGNVETSKKHTVLMKQLSQCQKSSLNSPSGSEMEDDCANTYLHSSDADSGIACTNERQTTKYCDTQISNCIPNCESDGDVSNTSVDYKLQALYSAIKDLKNKKRSERDSSQPTLDKWLIKEAKTHSTETKIVNKCKLLSPQTLPAIASDMVKPNIPGGTYDKVNSCIGATAEKQNVDNHTIVCIDSPVLKQNEHHNLESNVNKQKCIKYPAGKRKKVKRNETKCLPLKISDVKFCDETKSKKERKTISIAMGKREQDVPLLLENKSYVLMPGVVNPKIQIHNTSGKTGNSYENIVSKEMSHRQTVNVEISEPKQEVNNKGKESVKDSANKNFESKISNRKRFNDQFTKVKKMTKNQCVNALIETESGNGSKSTTLLHEKRSPHLRAASDIKISENASKVSSCPAAITKRIIPDKRTINDLQNKNGSQNKGILSSDETFNDHTHKYLKTDRNKIKEVCGIETGNETSKVSNKKLKSLPPQFHMICGTRENDSDIAPLQDMISCFEDFPVTNIMPPNDLLTKNPKQTRDEDKDADRVIELEMDKQKDSNVLPRKLKKINRNFVNTPHKMENKTRTSRSDDRNKVASFLLDENDKHIIPERKILHTTCDATQNIYNRIPRVSSSEATTTKVILNERDNFSNLLNKNKPRNKSEDFFTIETIFTTDTGRGIKADLNIENDFKRLSRKTKIPNSTSPHEENYEIKTCNETNKVLNESHVPLSQLRVTFDAREEISASVPKVVRSCFQTVISKEIPISNIIHDDLTIKEKQIHGENDAFEDEATLKKFEVFEPDFNKQKRSNLYRKPKKINRSSMNIQHKKKSVIETKEIENERTQVKEKWDSANLTKLIKSVTNRSPRKCTTPFGNASSVEKYRDKESIITELKKTNSKKRKHAAKLLKPEDSECWNLEIPLNVIPERTGLSLYEQLHTAGTKETENESTQKDSVKEKWDSSNITKSIKSVTNRSRKCTPPFRNASSVEKYRDKESIITALKKTNSKKRKHAVKLLKPEDSECSNLEIPLNVIPERTGLSLYEQLLAAGLSKDDICSKINMKPLEARASDSIVLLIRKHQCWKSTFGPALILVSKKQYIGAKDQFNFKKYGKIKPCFVKIEKLF